MEVRPYKQSKTTDFYYKLNLAVYFCGFPNFWIENFRLPKKFIKFFDSFNRICRMFIYLLIVLQWTAFFTQSNLTEKHQSNMILFSISQPMLITFRDIMSHKGNVKKIRELFYNLIVVLKRIHNDPEVEHQLIKNTVLYVSAVTLGCLGSVIMVSVEAVREVMQHNATFNTIITAYPHVDDRSYCANVTRVICYIIWLIFCLRVIGTYVLVIPITTCLNFQYKNLQSYFESLNDIFQRNDLQQNEMEAMYEAKFKVGIKMHSDTIRCGHETEEVCKYLFSGQIVFNILLLVILMFQLANSDGTLLALLSVGTIATSILISTGFYMWNSGDVTIEASKLGTAIFFSGWHNCMGPANVRVRKLVMITMTNAQRPVILKALGNIDLSYESYIKIVKASYSVFSVLF